MRNFLSNKKFLSGFLILILTTAFFRFWRIGEPSDPVFDETYYLSFAREYLAGKTPFDVHPPLGKLLILAGILIFGDNPFGWRVMEAVAGIFLIILLFLLVKEFFGKRAGLIGATLVSFEGFFLVYSRLALLDIYLVLFLFASIYFFWKFLKTEKIFWLIFSFIFPGAAVSVKWIAIPLLFLFLIWLVYLKKIKYFPFLILIAGGVYLVTFLANWSGKEYFSQLLSWHKQAANFHFTLKETHPYSSSWASWPFLIRPIWFYYKEIEGKIGGILAIGNPAIFWVIPGAILASLYFLIRYQISKETIFLLLGFSLFYFPWALVKRVSFIYYYLVPLVFGIILISFWLNLLWQSKYGKFFVIFYLAIVIGLFLFFYPILTGWPITPSSFKSRIWFGSWI